MQPDIGEKWGTKDQNLVSLDIIENIIWKICLYAYVLMNYVSRLSWLFTETLTQWNILNKYARKKKWTNLVE